MKTIEEQQEDLNDAVREDLKPKVWRGSWNKL